MEKSKQASRKEFKLLCVGNSFSDNTLKYAYQILNSFGVRNIVVANLYIGGCTINRHYNNMLNDIHDYTYRKNTTGTFINKDNTNLEYGLLDESWNYITMHQASGSSGMIDTYNDQINILNDCIRKSQKDNDYKLGWIMTWPYQQDSDHPEFVKYDRSQQKMYDNIINCVKTKILPNEKFDFIAPEGTAIQNIRTSYLNDTLTCDGFHLEELGEFVAGLTLILTISNWVIDDMNLDLIPQRFVPYINIIKEAVVNALNNPFKITNSIYKIDPILKRKIYKYDIYKDISYSKSYDFLKLDMYLPQNKSFDIVIHFHGGGLNSGTKDDDSSNIIGTYLASCGVGFVSINYRMYPEFRYPDFLNDAADAIKYVYDYMKNHSINGKIHVSGQSAGAYIAMMLCFDNTYLNNVSLSNDNIATYIIESGQPTTHFNILEYENNDPRLQRIDDKAPLYYINDKTKFNKLVLIAYTDDIFCRKEQNMLLYKAIKQFNNNANVILKIYEGTHCVNSTYKYRNNYVYADELLDFIK